MEEVRLRHSLAIHHAARRLARDAVWTQLPAEPRLEHADHRCRSAALFLWRLGVLLHLPDVDAWHRQRADHVHSACVSRRHQRRWIRELGRSAGCDQLVGRVPAAACEVPGRPGWQWLSLIHISEPTRLLSISYA